MSDDGEHYDPMTERQRTMNEICKRRAREYAEETGVVMEPGDAVRAAETRPAPELRDDLGVDPFKERDRIMGNIRARRAEALNLESRGVQRADEGLYAMENYRTAYREIYEDPLLHEVAKAVDRKQLAADDMRPTWDRYQETGEQLSRLRENPDFQHALQVASPDDIAQLLLQAREKFPDPERVRSQVVEQMGEERSNPQLRKQSNQG